MQSGNRKHKILKGIMSCSFIIAVAAVSVLLFCKRDILVYDDKYGYLGVLALSLICNATVFAPAPSLIVAVTAAQTLRPIPVILLGATGTTLGEMIGYLSGKIGRNLSKKEGRFTSWIIHHGAIAVFLFAVLPLPLFDLAGIASGYSKMKWHKFFVACFCGKLLKMAIYVFGSLLVTNQLGMSF